MLDEDWSVLTSLFPADWRDLAVSTGAVKGLRQDKGVENLLRTLLLHLACGYSLRETAVRAKMADLANMSDVSIMKRLKKSGPWLQALCQRLFSERGIALSDTPGRRIRLLDATHVSEPGKTGSLWRVHYSIEAPSLRCDYFELTPTKGEGTGESFRRFPVSQGDLILADRGYSHVSGIEYIVDQGAFVLVRLNPQNVPLFTFSGRVFNLLVHLERIKKAGAIAEWPVCIQPKEGTSLSLRLCVVRKSQTAVEQAHKRIRNRASRNGHTLKPETLIYAEYVMVLTNLPPEEFTSEDVLSWYRLRWQVELVFKRFKQIAALGQLPKRDAQSARAWLYGKLFVALMSEKLMRHAARFSPWGYELGQHTAP